MSERDRVPKAVLLIEVAHVWLTSSTTLRTSRLWDPDHHIAATELPLPAAIWADHIKLNEATGDAVRIVRTTTTNAC